MAINFCSDNVSGVSPEIMAAITAANDGAAMPYGQDEVSARLTAQFAEVFETDLAVFPVVTGSAANGLALASLAPPYGAIYCHADSHINSDECGAPEFFTAGGKLVPLDGEDCKIDPAALTRALDRSGAGMVHYVQPAVLSLTQATESGTLYRADEIRSLSDTAHERGLSVHMDGARFANALAATNASPAELSWRAGVDVLCLGATKNGAMAAEAVIFFNPDRARETGFRRKRGGHLLSKMRFLSAQLEAYLADGLWLRNAGRANARARELADGLAALPGARRLYPVEANEMFFELPAPVRAAFEAAGVLFYPWPRLGPGVIRLLTSFETTESEIQAALEIARRALEGRERVQ